MRCHAAVSVSRRMLLVAGLMSLGCAREAARRPSVQAVQTTAVTAPEPEPEPEPTPRTTETFTGDATYYSNRLAGRSTASGEKYDPAELTAAHRTLPFGTLLRVSRRDAPRSVVVRVNDRGRDVLGRLRVRQAEPRH